MGTVTTSTSGTVTAYGNQRKIERTSNGVLWTVTASGYGTINTLGSAYSTDGGVTWTAAAPITNTSAAANYVPNCSIKIDEDDYLTVAYKDQGNGYIYLVRGTPNAARTAYTWSAAVTVATGTSNDYPDLVVCRNPAAPGTWVGLIVYGPASSNSYKCFSRPLSIAANGTVTLGTEDGPSAILGTANANPGFPSVDFNHTGDGKTVKDGAPHWYVGWSAGATGSGYGIRFRKATYASGSWTWGTEREIDNTRYISNVNNHWLTTTFDGTRVAFSGSLTTSTTTTLWISDRDAADTTTTTRLDVPLTTAADFLSYGTATYDALGNLYLFGEEVNSSSGSRALRYRKWDRTAATLGAPVVIDSTANGAPFVSARRGPQGQAIDYVYTDGTASPYTVTSGRITLNQNPTAPTPQSPADNATWDSSTDQTVTQGYSDPDGNPASKVRVYYRPKGTSAPFAVIEQNTTAASGTNINITIPAGTWPGQIEWYGTVADSSGAWSDPSTTRTVTGIPAGLAALTGGGGGTAFSAWTISNATENARTARIGARSLTTTVTSVSPLTITVDGGPVTALRNAGYTPTQGDTVQADYVSGGWVIQDKVVG